MPPPTMRRMRFSITHAYLTNLTRNASGTFLVLQRRISRPCDGRHKVAACGGGGKQADEVDGGNHHGPAEIIGAAKKNNRAAKSESGRGWRRERGSEDC